LKGYEITYSFFFVPLTMCKLIITEKKEHHNDP